LFATENGLDLAVKGGGHSASGASSTDGGVVGIHPSPIPLQSLSNRTLRPFQQFLPLFPSLPNSYNHFLCLPQFQPNCPFSFLFPSLIPSVDLSLLNAIRVDPTAKLAYAQGGALWSDFDAATTAHGLVSVGGTVNHTGIGGLITGGGFGYLTGQYGLVIDNLVEVTMVTADGRIVKASEKENEDLFWGVRGMIPISLLFQSSLLRVFGSI